MTETTPGRDPNNGRFTVGNRGGPGRPKREIEAAILQALRDEFTPTEIAQGLRRAFELAESQGSARGMVAALTPILEYSLGKPVQRVETTGDNPMTAMFEQWKRAKLEAFRDALKEQMNAISVIDGADSGE